MSEAYFPNLIISLKQQLSDLKTTNFLWCPTNTMNNSTVPNPASYENLPRLEQSHSVDNRRQRNLTVTCTSEAKEPDIIMSAAGNLVTVLKKLYEEYNDKTPQRLKIVDSFLLYVMLTGIFQFLYCCLVGTFPFNSFLSGFISCVGTFVLGGMYSGFFVFYVIVSCNVVQIVVFENLFVSIQYW